MENKIICELCERTKVFSTCPGCGKLICEQCARFELVGSGCGCVWPVYYCSRCAQDAMINPNAALRDPET